MADEAKPTPIEYPTNRGFLQLIVTLQLAIIVGIVVVYLQVDGLPERTAGLVSIPGDNSGQIYQLQTSVDTLSGKVDQVVRILQPSPSSTPTP